MESGEPAKLETAAEISALLVLALQRVQTDYDGAQRLMARLFREVDLPTCAEIITASVRAWQKTTGLPPGEAAIVQALAQSAAKAVGEGKLDTALKSMESVTTKIHEDLTADAFRIHLLTVGLRGAGPRRACEPAAADAASEILGAALKLVNSNDMEGAAKTAARIFTELGGACGGGLVRALGLSWLKDAPLTDAEKLLLQGGFEAAAAACAKNDFVRAFTAIQQTLGRIKLAAPAETKLALALIGLRAAAESPARAARPPAAAPAPVEFNVAFDPLISSPKMKTRGQS